MHRHTLLVNKILGLCSEMAGWPSTLSDCGYRAYALERSVRVGSRTVVPDAMFLNEAAGHILVVDCKGGANVKPDQDGRYAQMRLEDILERARPPRGARSHTFAYAIEEEHAGRIRAHADSALIVFGDHAVRGLGDFGHGPLTRALREGVRLGGAAVPQLAAYPFSINDSREDIDGRVALGLSAYLEAHPGADRGSLASNAVALDVLRAVHPHLPIFAPSHRAELVGAVRESIERVCAAGAVAGSADQP